MKTVQVEKCERRHAPIMRGGIYVLSYAKTPCDKLVPALFRMILFPLPKSWERVAKNTGRIQCNTVFEFCYHV